MLARLNALDRLLFFLLCEEQIPTVLQVHPKTGAVAEVFC
jgi:hypothetical protein